MSNAATSLPNDHRWRRLPRSGEMVCQYFGHRRAVGSERFADPDVKGQTEDVQHTPGRIVVEDAMMVVNRAQDAVEKPVRIGVAGAIKRRHARFERVLRMARPDLPGDDLVRWRVHDPDVHLLRECPECIAKVRIEDDGDVVSRHARILLPEVCSG